MIRFIRFLAAGAVAAAVLTGLDAPRLWMGLGAQVPLSDRIAVVGVLLSHLLAVCGAIAIVAWLVCALHKGAQTLIRRGPLASAVLAATLLLPGIVWFTGRLLGGPGISAHPAIFWLRLGAPVAAWVVCVVTVLGLGALAAASSRGGMVATIGGALLGTLAGVALDWGDTNLFRTASYEYVHEVAAGLAALCLIAGSFFLLRIAALGGLGPVALLGLALLAPLGGVVVFKAELDPFTRFGLSQKSTRGRKLLRLRRAFLPSPPGPPSPLADVGFIERSASRRELARTARRRLDQRLGPRDDWNLVWITMDTVRADHLSAYGYEHRTSPCLDRLAARGTLFEWNYAQNPITHFSFQSMFYGRYPTATPLYRRIRHLPDAEEGSVTCAAILERAGLEAATIPAIPAHALIMPSYEVMARGFSIVNPGRSGDGLRAPDQNRCALSYLRRVGDRRFFLWVHYMDAHHPYVYHPRFARGTSIQERYDSEISAVDEAIGELVAEIDRSSFASRTVIVVNGDHGEALGDHNTDFHGSTLYDEQIRVPLVFRVPGLPAQRVRRAVENIDIMPTVLDLLGVDHELPLQGESLVPFLMGEEPSESVWPSLAYAELPDAVGELSPGASNRVALRLGSLKLIHDRADGIAELYDLASDPTESRNLAPVRPADVIRLRGALKALEEECAVVNRPAGQAPGERLDRLRAALEEADAHGRYRLLAQAILEGVSGAAGLVEERLRDPEEFLGLKGLLLHHACALMGAKARPYLRTALYQRQSWGLAVAGLEALNDLDRDVRGRVIADLRDPLERLLSAPSFVARRAARHLAFVGDDAGRNVLTAGLESPDVDVAWQAACSLAHLGDSAGAPLLRRELLARRFSPLACGEGLEALAALDDEAALPFAIHLVKDVYASHEIKRAAIAYLERLGGERVIPAFVFLLKGWDPVITSAAEDALDRLIGRERRVQVREAARQCSGAEDLVSQGRMKEAAAGFAKAAVACGSEEASRLMRLYASRTGVVVAEPGGRDDAERTVAEVSPGHPRGEAAGRGPVDGRARLEILEVAATHRRPLSAGTHTAVRLRLRNCGATRIPGGRWRRAPSLSVEWTKRGQRVPTTALPAFLPDGGLAPGEEMTLAVSTLAPGDVGLYAVNARVTVESGRVEVQGGERFANLLVWGESGEGLDPTDLVFEGEELMRAWVVHPGIAGPELDPDGSVTLAAMYLDPWMVGPALSDANRPVEVTLTCEAPVLPSRKVVHLQCYYSQAPEPVFSGEQLIAGDIPGDGSLQVLSVVLPTRDGRGVQRVRLDPGTLPGLFRIRSIRIRTR